MSLFSDSMRGLGRFAAISGLALGLVATDTVVEAASFRTQAWAENTTEALVRRLKTSNDFRIRMQAALELGKIRAQSARVALEEALSDKSSAVRAACVASLKSLGDKRAIPALRRAQADSSEAVRNQATSAIKALEADRGAQYLVEVGEVENGSSVRERIVGRHLKNVTRRKLSRMPNVVVNQEEANATEPPRIVFDARLVRLTQKRAGSHLEVSAKVDFILSKIPGRVIKGRLSGAATVHGERAAESNPRDLKQLRFDAIEAATESALSNVDHALRAAAE